jgi:hypothetical protein
MGRIALVVALLIPAVGNARSFRDDVALTEVNAAGVRFARQAIAAAGVTRAQSRTIYLNPNGVVLRPGENDSRTNTSSVVEQPTEITPWDIDEDTWAETVACMREIYAPFDVTITDRDPGSTPHIEAVFGGHPSDVGLPDNVAGVSPFTYDCSIIEHSVVFTFTDVLPDDPRLMCEVMAQEIAHSYGLDHEMLAADPMSYLTYLGERTFQDEMAACGEYGSRMCGIDGSICRQKQNSHQLLLERLGASPTPPDPGEVGEMGEIAGGLSHGCAVGGDGGGIALLLCYVIASVARRRARGRRHRSLLQ